MGGHFVDKIIETNFFGTSQIVTLADCIVMANTGDDRLSYITNIYWCGQPPTIPKHRNNRQCLDTFKHGAEYAVLFVSIYDARHQCGDIKFRPMEYLISPALSAPIGTLAFYFCRLC